MPMGGAMIGGAAISGVTSLVGSGKQADATKKAAQIQSDTAANSLAFQKGVYNTTLGNEQPYIATGNTATNALNAGISDGSLTAGYTKSFNAPAPFSFSGVNLQNDPAYQFDLNQGQQAIQRSAAAQGGLVSGGALRDLSDNAQGNALNAYQTAYGTAANTYQQNYANALQNYNTAYNVFSNNQANNFNRLSSAAGLGQNAVTQTATSGNAAASNNANTALTSAANIGNLTTQGAVAQSAGLAGVGNALTGGINQAANFYQQQQRQNSASSYNNTYYVGSGGAQNLNSLGSGPTYTGNYTDANGNLVMTS